MSKRIHNAIATFGLITAFATFAMADTVTVRKSADTNNSLPCSNCSLREAINTINQSAFTGVNHIFIDLPPSDPNCNTITGICKINLTLGSELLISAAGDLIIDGLSADKLVIDGLGATRVFRSITNLTLKNMTIQRGNGTGGQTGFSGSGAAVFMWGQLTGASLTLDTVVIQNNDSTFTTAGSGSVYLLGGTAHTIKDSTISGNSIQNCGGVILNGSPATTVDIVNTTVSFNTALSTGGGLCVQNGTMNVHYVTIADNTAFAAGGGGITVSGGTLNIGSTIVANNVSNNAAFPPDFRLFAGTINSNLANLIGDNGMVAAQFPAGLPNGAGGDWVGTTATPLNARLAPLGLAGGTTPTRPLYQTSLANNNGGSTSTVMTDQRGALRGSLSDIGAFEADPVGFFAKIPTLILNRPFSYTFTADNAGSTYCISSGSLPPGINGIPACAFLSEEKIGSVSPAAAVTIAGTPTATGTFTFTVRVTGASGVLTTDYQAIVAAPTLGPASLGGRIVNAFGNGLGQADITISGPGGAIAHAISSPFGYYRFDNLTIGEIYTVHVQKKGYQIVNDTQPVYVGADIADVNFGAAP